MLRYAMGGGMGCPVKAISALYEGVRSNVISIMRGLKECQIFRKKHKRLIEWPPKCKNATTWKVMFQH